MNKTEDRISHSWDTSAHLKNGSIPDDQMSSSESNVWSDAQRHFQTFLRDNETLFWPLNSVRRHKSQLNGSGEFLLERTLKRHQYWHCESLLDWEPDFTFRVGQIVVRPVPNGLSGPVKLIQIKHHMNSAHGQFDEFHVASHWREVWVEWTLPKAE
jgi:hypothetical protein